MDGDSWFTWWFNHLIIYQGHLFPLKGHQATCSSFRFESPAEQIRAPRRRSRSPGGRAAVGVALRLGAHKAKLLQRFLLKSGGF